MRTRRIFRLLAILLLGLALPARGQQITEFPTPSRLSDPVFITLGPDGALWFTESGLGKIGRITTNGVITEFPATAQANNVQGIASGSDGNLWFTEIDANAVGRITTAGVVTEFPLPTPLSGPYQIAAGPDGNLWLSETGGARIGRVTTSGSFTEFPISAPAHGITAGPDGNVVTGRTRQSDGSRLVCSPSFPRGRPSAVIAAGGWPGSPISTPGTLDGSAPGRSWFDSDPQAPIRHRLSADGFLVCDRRGGSTASRATDRRRFRCRRTPSRPASRSVPTASGSEQAEQAGRSKTIPPPSSPSPCRRCRGQPRRIALLALGSLVLGGLRFLTQASGRHCDGLVGARARRGGCAGPNPRGDPDDHFSAARSPRASWTRRARPSSRRMRGEPSHQRGREGQRRRGGTPPRRVRGRLGPGQRAWRVGRAGPCGFERCRGRELVGARCGPRRTPRVGQQGLRGSCARVLRAVTRSSSSGRREVTLSVCVSSSRASFARETSAHRDPDRFRTVGLSRHRDGQDSA
jgi:sugar lactone lactonase YvrE